jgi:hypothetical protein
VKVEVLFSGSSNEFEFFLMTVASPRSTRYDPDFDTQLIDGTMRIRSDTVLPAVHRIVIPLTLRTWPTKTPSIAWTVQISLALAKQSTNKYEFPILSEQEHK